MSWMSTRSSRWGGVERGEKRGIELGWVPWVLGKESKQKTRKHRFGFLPSHFFLKGNPFFEPEAFVSFVWICFWWIC